MPAEPENTDHYVPPAIQDRFAITDPLIGEIVTSGNIDNPA